MIKVFVNFNNVDSIGYIIDKIEESLYLVYVESINKKLQIESKYIKYQ